MNDNNEGHGGTIVGYIFFGILFLTLIGGVPEVFATLFGIILGVVLISNIIEILRK